MFNLPGSKKFLIALLIGSTNILLPSAFYVIDWKIKNDISITQFIKLIPDIKTSTIATAGLCFFVLAILIGQLIDAIGHFFIDELLCKESYDDNRYKKYKELIKEATPEYKDIEFKKRISAIIISKGNDDIKNLISSIWSTYEYYRNIGISLLVYIMLLFVLVIKSGFTTLISMTFLILIISVLIACKICCWASKHMEDVKLECTLGIVLCNDQNTIKVIK